MDRKAHTKSTPSILWNRRDAGSPGDSISRERDNSGGGIRLPAECIDVCTCGARRRPVAYERGAYVIKKAAKIHAARKCQSLNIPVSSGEFCPVTSEIGHDLDNHRDIGVEDKRPPLRLPCK